jgi:hypothetical protein
VNILPLGAELFQLDRQTDMAKLIVALWNFANELKILRSTYTVYLCVLCGTENKQRLFPYTALTNWFLLLRGSVSTARYGLGVYVFCVDLRTNRDYFPIQH